VNFDGRRRLMRQFEPVVVRGTRIGFLCFEVNILPEGDWFVAGSKGVLIASTSLSSEIGSSRNVDGRLPALPSLSWPLGEIGSDQLGIGCVFRPRPSGAQLAIVASLALQLALAVALVACVRKG